VCSPILPHTVGKRLRTLSISLYHAIAGSNPEFIFVTNDEDTVMTLYEVTEVLVKMKKMTAVREKTI
jgi:hypothetical protein